MDLKCKNSNIKKKIIALGVGLYTLFCRRIALCGSNIGVVGVLPTNGLSDAEVTFYYIVVLSSLGDKAFMEPVSRPYPHETLVGTVDADAAWGSFCRRGVHH